MSRKTVLLKELVSVTMAMWCDVHENFFSIRNGTLKAILIKIINIHGILNNNKKLIFKT